jgi:hypothetical protein
MLPARSKRYASVDGDIPREHLTSGWQLLLIVLVVLTLFYLVYPRRALVQRLYDQEPLDELSLSYVQNLLRADTRNADAKLLLTRHHVQDMEPRGLESLVRDYTRSSDPRQRQLARELQIKAFEGQLREDPTPAVRAALRARLQEALNDLPDTPLPAALAQGYASLAFRLDLPALGERLLLPLLRTLSADALEDLGHKAQARQEYRLASRFFLLAQTASTDRAQARRRFQLGLDALLAGGFHALALQTAEERIGSLATDLATVRYMVRLALACGQPERAAYYARLLVYRDPWREKAAR